MTYGFTFNAANQIASASTSNDLFVKATVPENLAYVANGLNQYDTAGTTGFTYDGRGNLVASREGSAEKLYWYTAENRLQSAPGATLRHDPLGRLLQLNDNALFAYEGERLIAEQDAAGAIVRRYVHGPGVDEPLVAYEGAKDAPDTR